MAIPELQRERIDRDLRAYCDDVPERVRHLLRYSFTLGSSAVELFEERPRWNDHSKPWTRHPVAKFRYVARRAVWELYCVHRDLKWHRYELLPAARRFDILLAEVEDDPTGIFWG